MKTSSKAEKISPIMDRIVVVKEASTFTGDLSQGTIILECAEGREFGKAIEELKAIDSRNAALRYASTCGMADPRVNGSPGHPYPINSEGLALDQVRGPSGEELPSQHPRKKPVRYRIDIPVTRRLV